jgi:hypothetical protein
VSDTTPQTQANRKVPRWIIGAGSGATAFIFLVLALSGGNAASRSSLISQAEELAQQRASRLGCDRSKDLRIVNAQYGTIGFDHESLERTAALENRAPAVHAVIALTCMNHATATEGDLFQQVIVSMETDADEPLCRGIESITRYDMTSHLPTGYTVDFDNSGNRNYVAKLRGVCDFQESQKS